MEVYKYYKFYPFGEVGRTGNFRYYLGKNLIIKKFIKVFRDTVPDINQGLLTIQDIYGNHWKFEDLVEVSETEILLDSL